MLADLLVPIVLFIASAIVCVKLIETRHRERMSMIERGIMELPKTKAERGDGTRLLTIGLLAVFISLGMILATWLHYNVGVVEEIIPGVMILFGGLGLLAGYAATRGKRRPGAAGAFGSE